jgi:hypothetical protein
MVSCSVMVITPAFSVVGVRRGVVAGTHVGIAKDQA